MVVDIQAGKATDDYRGRDESGRDQIVHPWVALRQVRLSFGNPPQRANARSVSKRRSVATLAVASLGVTLRLLAHEGRLGLPGFLGKERFSRFRCQGSFRFGCSSSLPNAPSFKFGFSPFALVVPLGPSRASPRPADIPTPTEVFSLACRRRGPSFGALTAHRGMARECLLDRIVRQLPANQRRLGLLGPGREPWPRPLT